MTLTTSPLGTILLLATALYFSVRIPNLKCLALSILVITGGSRIKEGSQDPDTLPFGVIYHLLISTAISVSYLEIIKILKILEIDTSTF